MELTLEQVEHIAELAKLSLTEEEKEDCRAKLSAILMYSGMLQELDTTSIPPTASVIPVNNVMREDEVKPSLPLEDVLANAPDTKDNCIRVKAILGSAE